MATTPKTKSKPQEIELDLQTMLTPLAIIIGAIIVSVPISLSVYFGLNNANLGTVAGSAAAEACSTDDPLSDDCYTKYAEETGLDVDEFQQCYEAKEYDGEIDAELSYGNEIGVQGTPTVLVGENDGGDKMKGFIVGAGVTSAELGSLTGTIKDNGIEKAAQEWKDKQLAGLATYETQLRDYYSQQGQSGETLDSAVEAGLSARKAEIEGEVEIKTYEYGDGKLRGNDKAEAVVMEFSDYECPYCQNFAKGDTGIYVKDQADSGDILFIYREFPLESIHPRARSASNAARCAGEQDKYFEYHDALFGL